MRLVLLIVLLEYRLTKSVLGDCLGKSIDYMKRIMLEEVPQLVLLGGSKLSQIGLFFLGLLFCLRGLAFFSVVALSCILDLTLSVLRLPSALWKHYSSLRARTNAHGRLTRYVRLHTFLLYRRSLLSGL